MVRAAHSVHIGECCIQGLAASSDGSKLIAVTQRFTDFNVGGAVWTGLTLASAEEGDNLVEIEPSCYYNLGIASGDRYFPGTLPGLNFTDIFMVSQCCNPYHYASFLSTYSLSINTANSGLCS